MKVQSSEISSRSNPLIKKYREISADKDANLFLLEGVRFLEEALRCKFPLESALYSPRLLEKDRGKDLLRALERAKIPLYVSSEEILSSVSAVENDQGVLAVAPKPTIDLEAFLSHSDSPFLLIAAGISDPGNLGSLIRTADAAGVDGVLVLENSASPFNTKAVRSSMGSILRLPVLEKLSLEVLQPQLQAKKIRLVATDSHSGVDFHDADYSGAIGLCLGSEADGIPDELRKSASLTVQIRLHHEVESLNVAAAGAILLFEISGRRKQA